MLGVAIGGRSSAGFAALAWTARSGDPAPLDVLATRRGRGAASAFAVGELIADKLPQTPSRLAVGPLAGRAVAGAAAGIGLAGRSGAVPIRSLPVHALVPGAVLGAAAAVAGAYAGGAWRRRAPFSSDLPAALLEDAVVVGLSWTAVRR